MVEFSADLGTRGALQGGPRVQLGTGFEDAVAGRLLRSVKGDILDQLAQMGRNELEGVRTALLGHSDDRVPVALRLVDAEIWARRQTATGYMRGNDKRFSIVRPRQPSIVGNQ